MRHILHFGSFAGCLCIGLVSPVLAAEAVATTATVRDTTVAFDGSTTVKPAEACLGDLRAFTTKIDKDGFWLDGSGDGYGYPAGGWGDGYGYGLEGYLPPAGIGYQNARPGYEVRTLLASANILARQGQQKSCEDVLSTTTMIYDQYKNNMLNAKSGKFDDGGWTRQQINAAQPVSNNTTALRSDELIGTELRNQEDEELGTVDDLVMSPATGKISYLIVARGGIFGIDRKYVPVPWSDIKASPNMNILVLDSTRTAMEQAPQVKHNQFLSPEQYTETSQKVDSYWKTHLAAN